MVNCGWGREICSGRKGANSGGGRGVEEGEAMVGGNGKGLGKRGKDK
jgi:hypothetical protein